MIISLIGNDGSGKSTISKEIQKHFSKSHKVTLIGEFDFFIIKKLRNLLLLFYRDSTATNKITYNKFSPYLVFVDLFLQHLYFSFFQRDELIIRERGYLDFLATWQELRISNSLIEKMYSEIQISDLVFYIKTDSKNAYYRIKKSRTKKQIKPKGFYELKAKLYSRITRSKNLIIIDNNGSLKKSLEEINFFINLKYRLTNIRSFTISGLDGSGKSTTVNNLSILLTNLNKKHKIVHFYYHSIVRKIIDKIRKEEYKSKTKDVQVKAVKPFYWKYLILFDSIFQYYFYSLFFWNRLIIFDRFFLDYLVSFKYLNVSLNSRWVSLLPKIRKNYLLIGDYKILQERKPEHSIEFLEECGRYYKDLSQGDLILIDSTKKNPQEVVLSIVNQL